MYPDKETTINHHYVSAHSCALTLPTFSLHACTRMQQRGIRPEDIQLVLRFGRRIYARGLEYHVIGRKEVQRWALLGVNISHLSGMQVLIADTGLVVTTYRSHNLHVIQAVPRRKQRAGHQVNH